MDVQYASGNVLASTLIQFSAVDASIYGDYLPIRLLDPLSGLPLCSNCSHIPVLTALLASCHSIHRLAQSTCLVVVGDVGVAASNDRCFVCRPPIRGMLPVRVMRHVHHIFVGAGTCLAKLRSM